SAGPRDAVVPSHAYSFRNRPAEPALVVTLAPFRPTVEQDLRWHVHADRAELLATLRATAAEQELLLVEWDVPAGVTVAEITGDNVRGWTRPAGEARGQLAGAAEVGRPRRDGAENRRAAMANRGAGRRSPTVPTQVDRQPTVAGRCGRGFAHGPADRGGLERAVGRGTRAECGSANG